MAYPDQGPLLDEQLDELELIIRASENDGCFSEDDKRKLSANELSIIEILGPLDYILGWHDRHDRKLLEAARWALAHGWQRSVDSEPNSSS